MTLNVAGHPKRCFVDIIKKECSAERCQLFELLYPYYICKDQSLEPTKVIKTNTEGIAEEDKLIEEKTSEMFFLGEENIMALKDNTSKYQFTHSSFELCYPLNNRINAGQLPTGPNCPHKIALCLELINKKKLPLKENKSSRDPD